MKLISYLRDGEEQLGFIADGKIFHFHSLDARIPPTMGLFLENWETHIGMAQELERSVRRTPAIQAEGISISDVSILAPVPAPPSLRDGYAFRQHVAAARRNRKVPMIPEFDSYPVFYFSNHRSVVGPGAVRCMPDHFEKLDFELEVAIVISKRGRNIRATQADEYIAGLMVMNDFSARRLQMEEMMLNLGPAKGKDFATSIGPWLVTPDELEPFVTSAKENHIGKNWKLAMSCTVQGKTVSRGQLSDMDWTFAELIERASYGADLYPGDIIGSGTVGTGCFLELNGTAKLEDPDYGEQWLLPGDEIRLSVEGLGVLVNTMVREESELSLLKIKK